MKPAVRATIAAAAALLARGAMACPSCAGSASSKDPNIWPLVGLFMLVPWILAAVVTILVRRESAAFVGASYVPGVTMRCAARRRPWPDGGEAPRRPL
jgi:hypothetical protein